VLFNTLAYAEFLALVFVVAWALVERRLALILPFLGLLTYVLFQRSLLGFGLVGVCGFITVFLIRACRSETNEPPPARIAALQLFLQTVALGFLTTRATHLDPVSFGLAMLGVPVTALGPLTWIVGGLGIVGVYFLLVARKVRLLFILGASYVFYAHWDFRFLPLIWGSSTADFWLAKKIHAAEDARVRKRWLLGTVVLNLGVLGFFKYFNFGVDSVAAALQALGVTAPEISLRVALPVGISFFTFESMSYVIDVYRKELEPQKSYFEYLSFVAFFPHLVAGPIVRPRDLLPQLAGVPRFNALELGEGLFLIAVGLSKKIIIGDYLALNLVDRVFDAPLMYSALEVYAAVLGYALQIYCDFSGYTDIAIGSALLLGVRFPLNFDSPYKAHDIVDFWRRWHISLSTWLRDYLYIPLGGNRRGRGRTYFNLLATMVLGGLWHGAAWTFVAWGFLHGGALALTKWWDERKPKNEAHEKSRALSPRRVLSVFLTFHLVCAGWIFFRSESFEKARLIFVQLGSGSAHHQNLTPPLLAVLLLGITSHYVPERLFSVLRERFCRSHWALQALALTLVAIALRRMASSEQVPFVYFQF
jgi:alginate O-acetyltransferase complex protein AlgI